MKGVLFVMLTCVLLASCSEKEMGRFLDNTGRNVRGKEQKLWCTPGHPCPTSSQQKQ